ncbi:MAG: YlmC/YmxH family sporulation protein [Ruminococcaceae bacterium]|nr:YlmC/YmxH family sporulation protein [Oscillospiraceae bacterium]
MCTISELKNKEVINLCDGRRLGFAIDAEVDLDCGKLISILVPPEGKLICFGKPKCDPIRILWNDIDCIGDDVILVRVERRLPGA